MKRADLRVGMHVRTGMNRKSEFFRSEGFVLDMDPWQSQKWNRSSPYFKGGTGVAIAERMGRGVWLPNVVTLGSIAPYEETMEDERRVDRARREYKEAEQLRRNLWIDEVDDLNVAIAKALGLDLQTFVAGGRERPNVSINIGVLRDLVERAK